MWQEGWMQEWETEQGEAAFEPATCSPPENKIEERNKRSRGRRVFFLLGNVFRTGWSRRWPERVPSEVGRVEKKASSTICRAQRRAIGWGSTPTTLGFQTEFPPQKSGSGGCSGGSSVWAESRREGRGGKAPLDRAMAFVAAGRQVEWRRGRSCRQGDEEAPGTGPGCCRRHARVYGLLYCSGQLSSSVREAPLSSPPPAGAGAGIKLLPTKAGIEAARLHPSEVPDPCSSSASRRRLPEPPEPARAPDRALVTGLSLSCSERSASLVPWRSEAGTEIGGSAVGMPLCCSSSCGGGGGHFASDRSTCAEIAVINVVNPLLSPYADRQVHRPLVSAFVHVQSDRAHPHP